MFKATLPDEKDRRDSNASTATEADSKKIAIGLSLAPLYAPDEALFQVERSDHNKKRSKAEVRTFAHYIQKARKKANKEEFGRYSSDESSEYDEETEPGAYGVAGSQADNHPIEEDQPTVDGSNRVDDDVSDKAMLVEAKLAPELTSAQEVNIQEEEEMIVKKKQYKRVLWFAMVFYGLAVIGNIIAFVLLFVNPPPAFGRFVNPLWNGLLGAFICLLIATSVILTPTSHCCHSYIRIEEYAPDDKQLLREAQVASSASCLLTVVAILIMVTLLNLQWLAYALMTWVFAGTVFAFSRVRLLRRSKETRPKTPKLVWVLSVLVFIGLTGATIWRCWNPLYPDCTVENASWIGDGECDAEPYITAACGYDGGDCITFLKDYPGCIVKYPLWIADGVCDGGTYNTIECGYDGGDCVLENQENYPDCMVPNPSWIGDGDCDGRVYGTVECGYDGGDCLGPGERCRGHRECASEVCNSITKVCDSALVSELYPNCSVGMPIWIGNGKCDGGYYASEACGFDGGDCLKLGKPCLLDDECASGFCNADTKVCYLGVLQNYPGCIVEYPRRIGDGECHGGAYNSEECGYDGGDCFNPLSISASPTLVLTFHMAVVAVLFPFHFLWARY